MEKFIKFIAEILGVEPNEISLETKYGELAEWDSLMMMRLIMEIEEEYNCVIPIEDAAKIKSINDLYCYTTK